MNPRPLCRCIPKFGQHSTSTTTKHSTARPSFLWTDKLSHPISQERAFRNGLPSPSPLPLSKIPSPTLSALLQNSRGIMRRVQPQASDDVEFHCWHDLWEDKSEFLKNAGAQKREREGGGEFDRKIFMIEERRKILIVVKYVG